MILKHTILNCKVIEFCSKNWISIILRVDADQLYLLHFQFHIDKDCWVFFTVDPVFNIFEVEQILLLVLSLLKFGLALEVSLLVCLV